MIGIVAIDRTWETSAIPAATVVSLPQALGITTLLSPRGTASGFYDYICYFTSKSMTVLVFVKGLTLVSATLTCSGCTA